MNFLINIDKKINPTSPKNYYSQMDLVETLGAHHGGEFVLMFQKIFHAILISLRLPWMIEEG